MPLFWEALEICERTGDLDGQIAYLGSLHEAQRWLGETAEAAALADRLGARCEQAGKSDRAAWARHRAQRIRAGEPLVRVVLEADGKSFELDDLSSPLPRRPVQVPVRTQPDGARARSRRWSRKGDVSAARGTTPARWGRFAPPPWWIPPTRGPTTSPVSR